MKIEYESWNPRGETLSIATTAYDIVEEYRNQGYTLTLRQLYYQFVARGLIPNTERSYKNLGRIVTKARLAGMISWMGIEDRNRSTEIPWTTEDEEILIADLPHYIRFDQWERQEHYLEVWVEKEALGSVISKACNPFLVPHMSCKGYLSASEAWRAGRRFKRKQEAGKTCHLIHLGDHDPSGLDMTRDNDDRVKMFSESYEVQVHRIALNMDQVHAYNPPPNPTKVSDSRAPDYIAQHGHISWELDALEPSVLVKLIRDKIGEFLDQEVWDATLQEEEAKKQILRDLSDNWDAVRSFLAEI